MTIYVVEVKGRGIAGEWRASRARAIRRGNIESDDDEWIAFLVVLTDPTDEAVTKMPEADRWLFRNQLRQYRKSLCAHAHKLWLRSRKSDRDLRQRR